MRLEGCYFRGACPLAPSWDILEGLLLLYVGMHAPESGSCLLIQFNLEQAGTDM